ncbi:cysteine desulfurase / selenocysteine lyase [Serratia symbiotica str. 'Cinara cedri']|nr:cysteine desulfurase / selenocysteine lyase [Serratia symbiotica str. 'Cinara cedri']
MSYPIDHIRRDFPLLHRKIHNHPLVYLDSAATAQKPQVVINSELEFYCHSYAAVHRGTHTLSSNATQQIEAIRNKIAQFLNAASAEEIIFVKGATEGINLVANSFGRHLLHPGDSIIITEMEHHANIVPWQILAQEHGLNLRVWPLHKNGTLDLDILVDIIDSSCKLLSITQVSNVLGTINPLRDIIIRAKKKAPNLRVLIDGAQAVMHNIVDVQALECDFYVFSGHKLYGPSGIGVLYGRRSLLQQMPPWELGGAMIQQVSLISGTTFTEPPWRFEAGSPNTAAIIGLGAAIDYVNALGLETIHEYEQSLIQYALEELYRIPTLKIYGSADRTGVISFNLGKHHAYDVGSFLDTYGIAIRTGHHCAMPLMEFYKVPSMCRASLALYNTQEEVMILVSSLKRIQKLLD